MTISIFSSSLISFITTVLFFPINFVLKTLTAIFEFIGKGFVNVVGGQEEKLRLKSKYHLKTKRGGGDNK